jgi:hypothetical protein
VKLGLVDDEPQEEISEEWEREPERDDHQHNPYQRLKQHVAEVQVAD